MKNRNRLMRVGLSVLVLLVAELVSFQLPWVNFALFLTAYLIIGGDVLIKAGSNIIKGQIFDENFLMSIATIGAFIIGEYPEAVGVMLFYQVGEYFQTYAVHKSRGSIGELMNIRPDFANVERNDELVRVEPDEVEIGETIVVKPGERIPLDGLILAGESLLDTAALTGESMPRQVMAGSEALSGCINLKGLLRIKVTKGYAQSTVAKILDLVENASSRKSNSENFITKFARYYTPAVVIIALGLALIPPLVVAGATFSDWVYRALVFLVISCPCALVISVPLSFFGGIGGSSRLGILVKGSNYLEALAQTTVVVFDKTGTLTKGEFKVTSIKPVGMTEQELLALAAHAEHYSNHPISLSLQGAYGKKIAEERLGQVEELSGLGLKATVDGKEVLAGNGKLMAKMGVNFIEPTETGTVIHLAVEGAYAGYVVIADEIKPDAQKAIKDLKAQGIKKTVMLTGDSKAVGEAVGKSLGIDEIYTQLLPGDKVAKVEELLAELAGNGKLAFVGDGINDAPVLARADLGIAMGGLGSDAAIEAADLVIMTDEPSKIPKAMQVSKKTLTIVKQNIVFALGIKLVVLVLGAMGIATMWLAVFADVGVSVLAILNAMRMLRVKQFM